MQQISAGSGWGVGAGDPGTLEMHNKIMVQQHLSEDPLASCATNKGEAPQADPEDREPAVSKIFCGEV